MTDTNNYHYCNQGDCLVNIPQDRTTCPAHELVYRDQEDSSTNQYLEGLAPLAANLEKIIEGSKLNEHELMFLSHLQGYLSAGKVLVTKLKGDHEPIQP